MSVRRLAEPAVQPASFAFKGDKVGEAQRWVAKYPKGREQSAIIPLLMLAQEQEGWVTKAAIESIADMLGMPYIRALEVATFYTQFQIKPVGTRAHVQVCGTTPCMLSGAEALLDVCRSKIHPEQFHANAGGTLSWEEVECLGACVNAPMVMIFKDTYEDLTPARLGEIIDAFEQGQGASIPVGPQNGRMVSSPQAGLTALRDEKAILKSTRDQEAKGIANAASVEPATTSPNLNAAKPKTYANEPGAAGKSPAPSAAIAPAPEVSAAGGAGLKVEDRSAGKKPKAEKPSLNDKARPAGVERPAQPDDLKLISGVGPKIEGILHSLGIFTFAQIASWKQNEREWVDGYLNFRGRIDRDDWVRQADALSRGGVDEYVRVFGKKPV